MRSGVPIDMKRLVRLNRRRYGSVLMGMASPINPPYDEFQLVVYKRGTAPMDVETRAVLCSQRFFHSSFNCALFRPYVSPGLKPVLWFSGLSIT